MPDSLPPTLLTCSTCGAPVERAGTCERCRAGVDEPTEALLFMARRLEEWNRAGRLTDDQWKALASYYERRRQEVAAGSPGVTAEHLPPLGQCWSCKANLQNGSSHCGECGAPTEGSAVKSLRFYRFLVRELSYLEESGSLALWQYHEFSNETKERIAALKRKLESDRALPVEAIRVAVPRRSFIDVLLDPRSIQWLLATGGGLLVLGLVIWLSSLGVFDNPITVAVALGLGNAVLLAGGAALILGTRYQMAGRALTLLACLVMPLNLWFYHSYDLITLQGHLWVAALVCCAVYLAAALMLRDTLFVYVLVGGMALTGLLLLGDLGRLEEIIAPSTLLVVLALACLHLERIFPNLDEGPFTRRGFGMAFFWSAQALLGAGLLLLLGAQIVGFTHAPIFRHFNFQEPAAVQHAYLPWTIALTLAGTYAYIYSDVVVRRIGVYLYLAAFTLLWAEVQLLALIDMPGVQSVIIVTLSLTALAVNALQSRFDAEGTFSRTVPPLGLLLSMLPVGMGVLLQFQATNSVLHHVWPFEIIWAHVGAMAVAALCCRAGAYFYRHTFPALSAIYFFLTAAATLVFAAGLVWMLGLQPWETQAPLLMLIPIAYLVASRLYRGHTPEEPLVWVAHASTVVMLVCSAWAALEVTPQVVEPIRGDARNLLLALFGLEAAIFYGLAAVLRRSSWAVYFATALLCGAFWQLLSYFHLREEFYTVAFSLLGLVLLVSYRFALLDRWEAGKNLGQATFSSANALTALGFVAGALLSMSRFAMSQHELALLDAVGDWHGPVRLMIYLLVFLSIVSLLAALLVGHPAWRRGYLVLTVINGLLLVLMFHKMSLLSPWQKLEIVTCLIGLVLLVVGHVGWYRETEERHSDMVGFALLAGAISLVLPLLIASYVHRLGIEISWVDELLLVLAGVVLLGSGIICRLRAPTLFGALALGAYVLLVLISMHRFLAQQWIVGIYLTASGALLFGTGLVLSLYKDRLRTLPERIKRREGIFRVFGWR